MNATTTLERVRDLAKSKLLELQPLAGEEMSLTQNDPHRDGFVDGERALANRILALIVDEDFAEAEPVEDEMVLGK